MASEPDSPPRESSYNGAVVVDLAHLKMAFAAKMEFLLRCARQDGPSDPRYAPATREVYQRAYQRAVTRAAAFDLADDPSTVTPPPEFEGTDYGDAWLEGHCDGDEFGRCLRDAVLRIVIKEHDLVPAEPCPP